MKYWAICTHKINVMDEQAFFFGNQDQLKLHFKKCSDGSWFIQSLYDP